MNKIQKSINFIKLSQKELEYHMVENRVNQILYYCIDSHGLRRFTQSFFVCNL